ncbi:MAG: OadG family transporter subunit [Akkermansia sp.]|nr:OadG family transporter subunit [Akkermansia sp.]
MQILAALDMNAITYQVTGMCVVCCCLGFLSLILTVSGAVAQRLEAKRQAQAAAAKAALQPAKPAAPAPVAAPQAAPAAAAPAAQPELSPAQVAAIAAGVYNIVSSSITPELVAAIAAAVRYTIGSDARILSIQPADPAYGQSGRAQIMNSHFPVRR